MRGGKNFCRLVQGTDPFIANIPGRRIRRTGGACKSGLRSPVQGRGEKGDKWGWIRKGRDKGRWGGEPSSKPGMSICSNLSERQNRGGVVSLGERRGG
eukprot:309424-Hanusia_phi.AAC.2